MSNTESNSITLLKKVNKAIYRLNRLLTFTTDKLERRQIRRKRNALSDQAHELESMLLKDGSKVLNEAITALNQLTKQANEAAELGADWVLIKGFLPQKLIAIIESLIDPNGPLIVNHPSVENE